MIASFSVIGVPQPQGSKRHVGRGVLIESADLKPWRQAVAAEARTVAADLPEAPLDRPLCLSVQFRFIVPKTRRKAVTVNGAGWKLSTPDLDKLCRAIGDALTDSGLIVDDARIVQVIASKIEVADWAGAIISLHDLYTPPTVVAA